MHSVVEVLAWKGLSADFCEDEVNVVRFACVRGLDMLSFHKV